MIELQDSDLCPCCSGATYKNCCQEIVSGTKHAESPLALMRSRYTAHVMHNMPHIVRTMRGKALKLFDAEKTNSEWFELTTWTKLEIIDAPDVSKHDKEGVVEFKAYSLYDGSEQVLHERSKFNKEEGQWFYVAGQHKGANIVKNDKVGRNDACVCGSGKKFKKCCAV